MLHDQFLKCDKWQVMLSDKSFTCDRWGWSYKEKVQRSSNTADRCLLQIKGHFVTVMPSSKSWCQLSTVKVTSAVKFMSTVTGGTHPMQRSSLIAGRRWRCWQQTIGPKAQALRRKNRCAHLTVVSCFYCRVSVCFHIFLSTPHNDVMSFLTDSLGGHFADGRVRL